MEEADREQPFVRDPNFDPSPGVSGDLGSDAIQSSLLGILNGGPLADGMGMHSYHLPAVQRHYEWGEANVEKFVNDLFCLFDDGLPCQPLGNINVYKDNPSCYEYLIVDGQQRLMTTIIFLSVIHLVCMERVYDHRLLAPGGTNPEAPFYFRGARKRGELPNKLLPRFVPKEAQQEFWETFIISWGNPEVPNRLGEFWDESGNLQLHVAGSNVHNKSIMVAAHTIKEALKTHTTRRDSNGPPRLMIDNEELLGLFTTEVLSCTKLTFTAIVGGSSADLCHLFISSNDIGLILSDYDIIKANMLGGNRGARVPEGEENWEGTWEQHQNKLSFHRVCKQQNLSEKAQQATNQFEKAFDVMHKIHVLKRASSMHVDLRKFFILDLAARTQPARFMRWFFTPVVQSMDAIFNWRDLWSNDQATSASRISEPQKQTDRIYSMLRSMSRLWISTHETATQIMSWLPVLVLLIAQWDRSRAGHRALLDMMAALERRVTWNYMVKGRHLAPPARNISCKVTELLNSQGCQGIEVQQALEGASQQKRRRSAQTTKISGKVCGPNEKPTNEDSRKALEMLDLSEVEQKQLLEALVQLKDERSSYRSLYLQLLYDDALRSPCGLNDLNGPAPFQSLTDYDSLLLNQESSCWEREHMAPQKSTPEWLEGWSQEARKKWLSCPANVLPVSQRTNRALKNAGWREKLQAYLSDAVVPLHASHPQTVWPTGRSRGH